LNKNQPESPGELAIVQFRVTVQILAGLVVALFGLLFYYLSSYRTLVAFVAAAIAGAAGAVSAYYAAKSLAATTVQNAEAVERKKLDSAFQFIQRWNDPAFSETKRHWRSVLAEMRKKTPQDIFSVLADDVQKRSTVQDILNPLEELGLAVRMGAVDEEAVKDAFGLMVEEYYNVFGGWIEIVRKDYHSPGLYREFEWLRNSWKGARVA
jgi:TorA maturation chaperone TorD